MSRNYVEKWTSATDLNLDLMSENYLNMSICNLPVNVTSSIAISPATRFVGTASNTIYNENTVS